ncbi:glutaredoxin 2 isoform X2 [Scyliorhinus canicula]|uniref:glutaredoxin 2 isoform X2 n=1 Tax=Scyliorhinus canicula TaxID=7830 RepID=UPI0018F69963|nr:glutaredoxin 2 isoform X2 [Scyliorhinus canicula]
MVACLWCTYPYLSPRLPFVRMGQLFTKLPEAQREAALHFIRNQVVQNCVVIFSKTYCPYCAKAKGIFEEIGANFKAIELDQRKDGDHIQNTLEELTGVRTDLDRTNRMGGIFSGPQACQSFTDATAFQIIHDTITQNRVVIFSKTSCPYCDIVKNIFTDLGIPYKAIELDLRNDGVHLQCILTEMTGIKTVPKVFINGTCIGGGSDTVLLHSKGRLLAMVNECGPNSAIEGICILL